MAYATSDDIKREFPGVVIPATSANAADVTDLEAWIAEADAEVNAKLSGLYEVPITGTQALLVIKSIVIGLVAWRFAKSTNMKNELPVPAGTGFVPQSPNVSQAKATAFARLMAIQQGREQLIDAVQKTGPASATVVDDVSPTFEQGKEQW